MEKLLKELNHLDFLIDSKEAELEILFKADINTFNTAKNELLDLLLTHRDISSQIIEGKQCNKR